jgi:hypothetical protein
MASTFLQTLYRRSNTLCWYKTSVELTTLQESIGLLCDIDDELCQFWVLMVLRVLMSGRNGERDMEAEYVNKSVILRTGGPRLVQGIVAAMLEPSRGAAESGPPAPVSDLILMVASDILQSLLCSHYDTTTPDQFRMFIEAVGQK